MKANAKKLLALIMAMAMVLSLAAPAFAADSSADASVSLSAQDADVTYVDGFEATDNGFKVTYKTGTATNTDTVKWSDAKDTDLYKVATTENSRTQLVGEYPQDLKTVTATVFAGSTAPKLERYVDRTSATKKSLKDVNFADALVETNNYIGSTSPYQRVKGSYYVEAQRTGAATKNKVYFKLTQYVGGKFDASKDPVYLVVATNDDVSDAAKMRANLQNATTCDEFGDTTTTGFGTAITAANVTESFTAATETTTYTYAIKFADGATTASATDITTKLAASSDNSITFQVYASYRVNSVDTKETDGAKVKAALNKVAPSAWTVSNIGEADASGYFSVTATKVVSAGANDATGTAIDGGNTAQYATTGKVVLVDVQKSGEYKDGSTKKTLDAGYKVAGPVAVKKADLDKLKVSHNGAVDGNYYTWPDFGAMKADIQSTYCGADQSIAYVQLQIFVQDGETKNAGVKLSSGTVTVESAWAEKTGAVTTSGTLTIAADESLHMYATSTDVVAATCKKKGSETTVKVCINCGKKQSTSAKEIPIVETPLQTGTKANDYKPATGVTLTAHYIKDHESSVTSSTKEGKGSVVHKFKCNLGEYHDELEYTEEIDKVNLDASGKWNVFNWGTPNTESVRNPTGLYGYGALMVCDSDVEYTNVALNGDNYEFFNGYALGRELDGTYFGRLVSNKGNFSIGEFVAKVENGKVVTETSKTWYQTTVTVKDIKVGEKDCQDGSATIEVSVYKVATGTNLTSPEKVSDALSKKTATLVSSDSKAITVPAQKTHVDANNDGKCDNCSTEINQSTPDNENTTDISKAVVKFGALTYTGKVAQPTVTVYLDGVKLAKGVDYEVEELQAVNAGTYLLVVKGKGEFSGRAVGNVTINKAKNTIKVSKTSVTFKAKKLKKKAGSAALKVTKNKGKVTVKSSNKNITWKKSKITVAKKTKKGTYKVTFTAKGNTNYKAGSKTVKVIVK